MLDDDEQYLVVFSPYQSTCSTSVPVSPASVPTKRFILVICLAPRVAPAVSVFRAETCRVVTGVIDSLAFPALWRTATTLVQNRKRRATTRSRISQIWSSSFVGGGLTYSIRKRIQVLFNAFIDNTYIKYIEYLIKDRNYYALIG